MIDDLQDDNLIPDRLSVSINGFNLFQHVPPLEIRRHTFLVGPNGSGKSTFLRLLPLFALPERLHLPTLADKGFSIGHFAFQQQVHPDAMTTDPMDEHNDPSREGMESEQLSVALSNTVDVSVEFLIPRSHWVDPPAGLKFDLEEAVESMISFFDNEQIPAYLIHPVRSLLHMIKNRGQVSGSNAEHSADDNESPPSQQFRRVRIKGQYSRRPQWMIRNALSIDLLIDDAWRDVYSPTLQCLSVTSLSWFSAFRDLSSLLQSGLDSEGRIGPLRSPDGTFIGEEYDDSWDCDALDMAIHMAISQTLDPLWVSLPGNEIQTWVLSFFTQQITSFFADTRLGDLQRIDASPVLMYESDDIGSLVSQIPEQAVNSTMLTYWLQRLGIGEALRVEDLDGDGWRLQVLSQGKWQNVVNLGAGLARFVWFLFVLSRLRTTPIRELFVDLMDRIPAPFRELKNAAELRRNIVPLIESSPFEKTRIFAMEEPENRLHPRLQTYLADILLNVWDPDSAIARDITADLASLMQKVHERLPGERLEVIAKQLESAYCGERYDVNAFVVETHSEYLIRRLQSLVAHGRVAPEDIIIHYFSDPNSDMAETEETSWPIEINADGTLSRDFGPGFFGEAASLIDDLWQAWKPRS